MPAALMAILAAMVLLMLLLIQTAAAASSAVVSLNEKDLKLALNGASTLMFVKFYAPWCGFCKQMAPVWEELATMQSEVTMAKVDCTVHHSLCTNHDVESYPTFKFIQHRAMHDYMGARSKEALTAFVHKMRAPAVVDLTPAQARDVLAAYPPADGETFNGVVFVLTVRAPASPREDEHQAAEAVAEVEAAYRAAARRLHSSAAFACIRETPSDGATTDGEASVSVRLERLERGRPPVSMPSLPLIQHYPPGTTSSSTSSSSPSPVNTDVPTLRAAKALEGFEDKIAAFVNAQNHAFMTVFDAHNFRSAADSQRLLVMAVVKPASVDDEDVPPPPADAPPPPPNPYHTQDPSGAAAALHKVAAEMLNGTAAEPFLFGYLLQPKWKKWLKQYGCQQPPALLLLGLNHGSHKGWSYRCYRLDKYLPHHAPATEEKRAAKRAAHTRGTHEASGEAEEWVGATTALERKVARVLRKAGKGAVVFRTRTKPTGFFNGLLDHATEFIKGTYPWSLLFLIPVGLAIVTIVWECASPLLRRRRRKKTVAKTD